MLKKINIFSFLLLGLLILSCSKEESGNDSLAGKITCSIDGIDYTSTSTEVQMYPSFITIGATSGTKLFNFYISDVKVGTYPLNASVGNDATLSLLPDGFSTSNVKDANASLVITAVNTKDSTITGTFQFEATSILTNKKVKVTNGKITKVKYVKKAALGNSLSCTAGGEPFNAIIVEASTDNGSISISGTSLFFEQSLYLGMKSDISPGTYDLIDGTSNYASYIDDTVILFGYRSKSGKLTIKAHNKAAKTISGTFEFEGEEKNGTTTVKKTFKDGKFSVSY